MTAIRPMTPIRLIIVIGLVTTVCALTPPAMAETTTERIAGAARADTAAALARATDATPPVVFLVASTTFADGLVAGVAAAARGGVVLLLDPNGIPSATARFLTAAGDADLVIVGGTQRLPAFLDGQIQQLTGRRPARVAGADRYATAAALMRATFAQGSDEVWVATGAAAPDALSAGPGAHASGAALLSTARVRLPGATARALVALNPKRVTIVGGEAAVSQEVVAELEALVGEGQVRRLAGPDRYQTSAAVAGAAFSSPSVAVLATGRFWADALAATPLAAANDAPVMLVPRRCVTPHVHDVLASVSRVFIAGGEVAVAPRVEDRFPCTDEVTAVTAGELGASWRAGCPVGPADLRRITVDFHALDGTGVRTGRLVVHRRVAGHLVQLFDSLFDARFPFERITTVDVFGANDNVAMAANATTAFNCRPVAGSTTWSEHSYGTAVDVNPVQNPYVSSTGVQPPAGASYLDRTRLRPGMVVAGGVVEQGFADLGWGWGGRWRSAKDYQHFSQSGR